MKKERLQVSDEKEKPTAEVIQGPWPKTKRKVKVPDVDLIQLQENIAFADHLTESLMVQMIHTIGENGYNINGKKFIGNMAFIIETVKASLYDELGLDHPMTTIMKAVTKVSINKKDDDLIDTEVDLDEIEYLAQVLEDDEDGGPEIS
jgi:hypothetical protein|tara:strand:- start:514 stop:957 length:444 start_codon:yes stop_codon:yes gene_type:complete